jgi:hypothetical protein
MSEGPAQSGNMAVEVARLGRRRFENVVAADGASSAAQRLIWTVRSPSAWVMHG